MLSLCIYRLPPKVSFEVANWKKEHHGVSSLRGWLLFHLCSSTWHRFEGGMWQKVLWLKAFAIINYVNPLSIREVLFASLSYLFDMPGWPNGSRQYRLGCYIHNLLSRLQTHAGRRIASKSEVKSTG